MENHINLTQSMNSPNRLPIFTPMNVFILESKYSYCLLLRKLLRKHIHYLSPYVKLPNPNHCHALGLHLFISIIFIGCSMYSMCQVYIGERPIHGSYHYRIYNLVRKIDNKQGNKYVITNVVTVEKERIRILCFQRVALKQLFYEDGSSFVIYLCLYIYIPVLYTETQIPNSVQFYSTLGQTPIARCYQEYTVFVLFLAQALSLFFCF